MFPAGQGFDVLELLVFLTFTVQVLTEKIKSKKEKGKRLKPKSKY